MNYFEHDGPNGMHLCLIRPLMVSDSRKITATGKQHHAAYVRTIAKQLLTGLNFFHSLHLVYCGRLPFSRET
jgi:serine/threonine-protein kinase SRPK3